MSETIQIAIITTVVTSLMGALLGYMGAKLKHYQKDKDSARNDMSMLKLGIQALLRDRIIQAYNHYVDDKGYCPTYAKDTLAKMYKIYDSLGENGVIATYYKQLMALPTTKDNNDKN